MRTTQKIRFSFLAVAAFTLTASLALVGCGGGGKTDATTTNPTKWTGTKQLGVAGKPTSTEDIAVDGSGNVYVAGWTQGGLDRNTLAGRQDFLLAKYDSKGNKLYAKQTGVAGKDAMALGVAVDGNGNVYVTGLTEGGLDGNTLTGTRDYFLTKYDSSGNKLYSKQTGTAGTYAVAYAVAVDAGNNVYITGYTNGGLDGNTLTGTQDYFLVKYDSSGNKVYAKQTGIAGKETMTLGVAVDGSGNVYVTGRTNGGLDGNTLTGTYDYFLTKYDPAGNKLYTKQAGTTGGFVGVPVVAVDGSGNVYLTGFTQCGLDGNTLTGVKDYFLAKYDSSGNRSYTKQTGAAGKETLANGIAVDRSGNVYVTGQTTGGLDGYLLTGIQDYFLTKYDSAGNKLYSKQIGTGGTFAVAMGVAVDTSGNVYVTGQTNSGMDGNSLMGTADYFVTKYDSTGNKQ